jgi:hypothetical protein
MSGRSLCVSEEGLIRARQALKRKGITQTAIANTGIASWSTVSKFFNSKPIDRFPFIEICHFLDLQWESMVDGLQDLGDRQKSEPQQSNSWQLVRQQSAIARQSLTPRILERIPREVVEKKYLPAIHRGTKEGFQRVVAIVGGAGYGKSTILGNLYDELSREKSGWVGLVLCASLSLEVSPSLQDLAIAFGESLTGQSFSIVSVCEEMHQSCSRGVLLIDTVDLVASNTFVLIFDRLLRQILETGTTVVFTCRDQDYNEILEPIRERMSSIAQLLDRHTVPAFNQDEISQAATTFFARQEISLKQQGEAFAKQILALSADSRSLREIIENPLLLALLCDLFAREGNVPTDLTVSKLYQRYWQEKIAYSRSDRSRTSLLAIDKERLCLAIARSLFGLSQSKLQESLYRDEIDIGFDASLTVAYDDLLSEGVIEHLPSMRVHFFHQTLLEYAIAYWLTRQTVKPQRIAWFNQLHNADATSTYWYPVLRQHLTILAEETEWHEALERLDRRNLAVFSAIAFAAASRDRPDALQDLLPTALELGEVYQKRLRQALEIAPRQLIEYVWDLLLSLLERSGHTPTINTAKTISLLIAQWWYILSDHLPEAILSVARRDGSTNHQIYAGKEDRAIVYGWLLQHCLPLLAENPKPKLLQSIREHYQFFGHDTRIAILDLHSRPTISAEIRREWLIDLLKLPIGNFQALEVATVKFVAKVLHESLSVKNFSLWQTWQDALYSEYAKGWDAIQASAIGCYASEDLHVLSGILEDIIAHNIVHLRRNYIAIAAALEQGAGEQIALCISQKDPLNLAPACLKPLVAFVNKLGDKFPFASQELLAVWLSNLPQDEIPMREILFAVDTLADASLTARSLLRQLIFQLPERDRQNEQVRLLRFEPIANHPHLLTRDKSTQSVLVTYYRQQAPISQEAIAKLLKACLSSFKDIAVSASQDFCNLPMVTSDRLIPLLKSRFIGVRVNVLKALFAHYDKGRNLTEADLATICGMLLQEDNQAVACPLCEIVAAWVQRYRQLPDAVFEAIGDLPNRVGKNFDGGLARVYISALKAIAQTESPKINRDQIASQTRYFLKSINLIKISHSESETIDLLSAVQRLYPLLLTEIINEDCPILAERKWLRTIFAVIKTIRRVEGVSSPLLDAIALSDWCSQEVENVVLEIRGV